MAPESGPPEHEQPEQAAQREKRAWDAIVADLTGTLDIGDLEPKPDPIIDELLDDEGDYVPPHPPPLKAPADVVARFAWAGALGGPVFLFVAYAMDLGKWLGAVGVIASIAGFATLIARLPHERDDDGDGAVV